MKYLERYTKESDSLVIESQIISGLTVSIYMIKFCSYLFPSSMGHEESRVNLRGPPRKAKYSWMADSELVP